MANLISYKMIWFWVVFTLANEIGEAKGGQERSCLPPPAIFVFGDSLSDTGNVIEVFPFLADAENSPYGDTFFHAPSGRFSDGRLILDFMALAWRFPLVEPYFSNIVPNYRHGINFAVAGATARNVTEPVPFYLPLQTDQFVRFKRNVIASLNSTNKLDGLLASHVPEIKSFEDGLYMIFVGVNDFLISLLTHGQPPSTVKENIVPQVTAAISKAVQDLHREGAKNFMVFNVLAIGCIPTLLTLASPGPYNSTDALGCLKDYNELVQFSNHELEKALSTINQQLKDTNIMVADIYGFMLEAVGHPSNFGFDEAVTLKACCGYGGDPYNYSPLINCGKDPEAEACSDPSKYISWDGVHLTDAFSGKFVGEMMKESSSYLRPLKRH
ncbi:GDSL esterase/lipase At4g01130-like [Aristolochia californica]|uniref:GDSL esterase/lipase At4g01130-like n=1 Tax=Aristolochia californica TaxID=171875 RepID=UPI0035D96EE1